MANANIHASFVLRRESFELNVDLVLPGSGVTVLFGHSGSGKTTLLRCLAGLERAEPGKLTFKGERWQDDSMFLPTHQRPLGMVFQQPGLFDHLNTRKNLLYAVSRADSSGSALSLSQVIELLGIGHLLKRMPTQLSGGEKQRVAIARALLINPRLLLMDEPLASLDAHRKQEILPYLENLRNELAMPIIYVTHSADEVARLADHIVAMEDGQAVASGTLAETFNSLSFPLRLGEDAGAIVEAVIAERDDHWHLAKVTFPGGNLWFRDNGHPVGQDIRVRILARDISLSLMHADNTSIINALPARVAEIVTDEHPALALVKLNIGGNGVGESVLIARVTRRSVHNLNLIEGKEVWAQIKSVAIVE